MASTVTRATIAKLSARIEELARRVDPAPEMVLVVIDGELDALLGTDATELVCKRHVELFPADARAKRFLIIRTGATRDAPHSQADRASGELLSELRKQRQKPLAITWQPPPDTPLQ
jgi:hypothetical protein